MAVTLPELDVLVVTWQGGPLLERCLRSMARQRWPARSLRVVVSADRPLERPPTPGLEGRLGWQVLPQNRGFAAAANAGLRAMGPGPLVLLNDDTEAEPGFLEALAAALLRGGEGIYQPQIRLLGGGERLDNLGHGLFPDGFNLARGRGRPLEEAPGEVGAFSGAAVLFSAEVRERVGLFHEGLEAFGEDLDLSLRARRQGYAIRAVPEAIIGHALGASYGRVSRRKCYLVERNRVRAALRSLPVGALLTMPVWTGLRLSLMGAAALGGRGLGSGVGPEAAAAALVGGLAGYAWTGEALRLRAADAPGWVLGEREMWAALGRFRPRWSDLLAEPG